jgi:uncharacterized membrane protein
MLMWAHSGSSFIAAFLASLVEFVEALTVVLAVGTVRGWREALTGAAAALLVLILLVVVLGQSLSQAPLSAVRLVVGLLALLFGARWLRKAILRSAGVIALHNETATFDKEMAALHSMQTRSSRSWDSIALLTSFKIVMLEGAEVVFIVVAIAASGQQLMPASVGAVTALILVIILGIVVHRPLARVPENALKHGVGALLSAFGTFWLGEGMGLHWPRGDLSLLMLVGGYLLLSQICIALCRARRIRSTQKGVLTRSNSARKGPVGRILDELVSLFIDDAFLATGLLVWTVLVGAWPREIAVAGYAPALALFAGFMLILGASAFRGAR